MKTRGSAKNLAIILSIFMLFILNLISPVQAAPVVLKMGTLEPPANPISMAGERLGKLVNEKSKGSLRIEVFPASQLGNFTTQIEGVMMGSQDIFLGAPENLGQFEKDYNILSLAFVFRDQNHIQAFFRSPLHAAMAEKLRKNRGIRFTAERWNRTPRVLLAKKPVFSPDDLKDIKMRVPEITMYLEVWKALGTRTTQVPWGEVYLALKQGVVDAMEGPFDTLLGMKFYEAAPYITLTNHVICAAGLYINDKKFLNMPKELQTILMDSIRNAGDYFTKLCFDNYDRDMNEMLSRGAKFITVDRTPFKEKMKPLIVEMEEKGMWRKGLYQAVQDIK
jgi:tripartite ATP-independent transporter DctP family solute receptor